MFSSANSKIIKRARGGPVGALSGPVGHIGRTGRTGPTGNTGNTGPAGSVALTSKLTFFVRSDGSDSNTGLVNSAGGAFLTGQKAINEAAKLNLGAVGVDIQFVNNASTPQTYTGTLALATPLVSSGGRITLIGDTVTPANLVLNPGAANIITVTGFGSSLDVKGLKFLCSGGGAALNATNGGVIRGVGACDFGACSTHLNVNYLGMIIGFFSTYTISGGAIAHMRAQNGGVIENDNNAVTVTGTPAFTLAFASASSDGLIESNSTWTGAATGVRSATDTGGQVNTLGAGAGNFPGNAAGTNLSGGQTDSLGPGFPGRIDGSNAPSGYPGEYNSTTGGTTGALVTATAVSACSASIPAGDWEIQAVAQFSQGAASVMSLLACGVNTATAIGAMGTYSQANPKDGASFITVLASPVVRVSISGATTYRCVVIAGFTGNAPTCTSSFLRWRRV